MTVNCQPETKKQRSFSKNREPPPPLQIDEWQAPTAWRETAEACKENQPEEKNDMLAVLAAACSLPSLAVETSRRRPEPTFGEESAQVPSSMRPTALPPAKQRDPTTTRQQQPNRKKKRPRLAPFPNKLQEIIANHGDAVCWDQGTRALVIRDPKRLTRDIMPKWFNTNGGDGLLKSFTRQLNYYGFHRVAATGSCGPSPTSVVSVARNSSLTESKPVVRQVTVDEVTDTTEGSSNEALVTFYKQLFGPDALVFINKDPTIDSLADFTRLIRFEKAANRPTASRSVSAMSLPPPQLSVDVPDEDHIPRDQLPTPDAEHSKHRVTLAI